MSQKLESAPAEVLKFEYKHPNNGESHTVSVTREEVSHHMCDVLFEKLCAEFCECEPVGETNVVDCRCDEYADEFERVPLAAPMPPAGGELEVVGWRDDGGRCITHGGSGRYNDPLVRLEDHRAHFTRLQAENAALQQRLNEADQRIDDLEQDKARLDSIEANCWDVRHHSSPIADTGDHSTSVEIIGHWMDKPHERVIGENYNENLRAAIDQAMKADAYPPARPEYPELDAALNTP